MSLLPWDNWIYHVDYKQNEVNQLHTQAVNLQNQIDSQISVFNNELSTYQSLYAGNAALIIAANVIQMNDLQLKDFTAQIDAIETPPAGFVPVSIASLVDELAGGVMVLKAIWNLGKLTKNFIAGSEEGAEAVGESAAEDLAEVGAEAGSEAAAESASEITAETVGEGVAEGAAEAAIEGASLAGLGEVGIGIFAAVGIDLVFGLINGEKEKAELDKQIASLQAAVQKCQGYYNTVMTKQATIETGIVSEENRFAGLVNALGQVGNNAPTFSYNYTPTVANASQFLGAMQSALSQYGEFVEMRNAWVQAVSRSPSVTKAQFLQNYLMFAPSGMTQDTLTQYWAVLAKYSDSMRAQDVPVSSAAARAIA
jgi:hypothetical protein